MEILFNYNWVDIVSCELQEDWMYKLQWENWWIYFVFKEEIENNF